MSSLQKNKMHERVVHLFNPLIYETILSRTTPNTATLRRGAELLLPAEGEVPGLARGVELRLLLELVHRRALLLHDLPGLVGAHRRLVAAGLTGEAAVGVAHSALIVALERVEVLVGARLLRIPLLVDPLLRVKAPDAIELSRQLNHLRASSARLRRVSNCSTHRTALLSTALLTAALATTTRVATAASAV